MLSRHLRPLYKTTIILLAQLVGPYASAQPKPPILLSEGKPFTITGKLEVKFQGWRSVLVIQTNQDYLAQVESIEKHFTAIELNSEGNGSLLARHAGETVTAHGILQMEFESPYYWNGVMLMADTVTLADSTTLHTHRDEKPALAATIQSYLLTINMVPRQYSWQVEAVEIPGGRALSNFGVGGCNLNGGGDVLNCTCARHFVPFRSGTVTYPVRPTELSLLPPAHLISPGVNQFGISDDASHSITVQVACKRETAGMK